MLGLAMYVGVVFNHKDIALNVRIDQKSIKK